MSASLIEDVRTWVAAQAGGTVRIGQFGQEDGTAVAIVATGGAGPDAPTLTATFQCRCRALAPATAHGLAWAIWHAVYPAARGRLGVRNVALSTNWRAQAIDAIQPPTDLGPTEGGYYLVTINIAVRAARLA